MKAGASSEKASEVKAMNAPSGIDLRPQPARAARVSKRAGVVVCCLALGVLGLFAYGGYQRQIRQQSAARTEPRQVAPATAAGAEILKEIQPAEVASSRSIPPRQSHCRARVPPLPGQQLPFPFSLSLRCNGQNPRQNRNGCFGLTSRSRRPWRPPLKSTRATLRITAPA